MTEYDACYEGNFLEALDIPEGALLAVEIEAVVPPNTEKDAAKRLIKKAILAFKGAKKRMILGKSSYTALKAMFGKDPETWVGKTVNLQRRYLEAGRTVDKVQNTPCVRIMVPDGTPVPKKYRDFVGSKTPY